MTTEDSHWFLLLKTKFPKGSGGFHPVGCSLVISFRWSSWGGSLPSHFWFPCGLALATPMSPGKLFSWTQSPKEITKGQPWPYRSSWLFKQLPWQEFTVRKGVSHLMSTVSVVTTQGGSLECQVAFRRGDCNSLAITLSDWVLRKVAYFQTAKSGNGLISAYVNHGSYVKILSRQAHCFSLPFHLFPTPFFSTLFPLSPGWECSTVTACPCSMTGTWNSLSRCQEFRNKSWEFAIKLNPKATILFIYFAPKLTLSDKQYVC